ncbi:MAG TPA: HDOD domain-containing protein [Syntrophales bacterium]
MSEVIESKILRHRIENIGSLPTAPDTLRKLSRIMEKPNVSLTEVASFVQSDPALTFRILKMVNSAVYGFPGRISSVSHAIMLLGLNVVKGFLLGVSVFELMQKAMTGLYEHSLGCAAAARIIAQKKALREPEEPYVAGFYDTADWDAGYIFAADRKGVWSKLPVTSISIGITDTERRTFSHHGELMERASEMKGYAKKFAGSCYKMDQREKKTNPV